jgi:aryl-alcohol dehydrogenase-like predicted oxidoreductase
MKSIERSLRRLRTDYVDLLQLHSCTAAVLERTDLTQTLLEAQESGKARFIGYSGDSKDAVAAINTGVFDTLQTSINLADQEATTLTLPAAHERSMGILAKAVARKCCLEAHATAGQSDYQEYWDRLGRIGYLFLHAGSLTDSLTTAVRFTLSAPGVSQRSLVLNRRSVCGRPLRSFRLPGCQSISLSTSAIWEQRSLPSWAGQV